MSIFEDEAYDSSVPKGILTVVASGFDGSLSYYDLRKLKNNTSDIAVDMIVSKNGKKKINGNGYGFGCEDLELPLMHSTATFDAENDAT